MSTQNSPQEPQDQDLQAIGDQVGRHVANELATHQRRQERQAYVAAALPEVMRVAAHGLRTFSAEQVASKAIDIAEAVLAELDRRDAPEKPVPAYYNELSGPPTATTPTA